MQVSCNITSFLQTTHCRFMIAMLSFEYPTKNRKLLYILSVRLRCTAYNHLNSLTLLKVFQLLNSQRLLDIHHGKTG